MSVQPFVLRPDRREPALNVGRNAGDGVGVKRGDAKLRDYLVAGRGRNRPSTA